jgi:hypothetical protein
MSAATSDRKSAERSGRASVMSVLSAVVIFGRTLVGKTIAGLARPGAKSIPGLTIVGVSSEYVDNSAGADGDKTVAFERGVYPFDNGGDITVAHVGKACYADDDSTVYLDDLVGVRPYVGRIKDVDSNYVWVDVGDGKAPVKTALVVNVADLVAADAKVYRVIAPCAGLIKRIHTGLNEHAVAGADATITSKINGVAVTGGVVTIALAASVIGDKDVATPTAANVVAEGDEISLTVGGGNTNTAAFALATIEIEPF